MNIKNLQSVFMATAIGISVSYVGISTYDKLIEARELQTQVYTIYSTDTSERKCPELQIIPGPGNSKIIKDACTNLYWHHIDLPLFSVNSELEGYTWQEAKDYCENLAVTTDGKSLLRLPTSDELLSLLDVPCSEVSSLPDITTDYLNQGCSPLVRLNETARLQTDLNQQQTLVPNQNIKYFYTQDYNRNNTGVARIRFADGIYWTADELAFNKGSDGILNADDMVAAVSINMYRGEVNNPLLNKDVRLNVRCIYDKPTPKEISDIQSQTYKNTGGLYGHIDVVNDISYNEAQWWTENPAGSRKYTFGYRKNWVPINNDVNNCPETLNTAITGDYNLCTGVTAQTRNQVFFECPNEYLKNNIYQVDGSIDPTKNPIICN